MATHSSILAWRIPRTEEPGGLQSMRSQRVGHNLATKPPLRNRIAESYGSSIFRTTYQRYIFITYLLERYLLGNYLFLYFFLEISILFSVLVSCSSLCYQYHRKVLALLRCSINVCQINRVRPWERVIQRVIHRLSSLFFLKK